MIDRKQLLDTMESLERRKREAQQAVERCEGAQCLVRDLLDHLDGDHLDAKNSEEAQPATASPRGTRRRGRPRKRPVDEATAEPAVHDEANGQILAAAPVN